MTSPKDSSIHGATWFRSMLLINLFLLLFCSVSVGLNIYMFWSTPASKHPSTEHILPFNDFSPRQHNQRTPLTEVQVQERSNRLEDYQEQQAQPLKCPEVAPARPTRILRNNQVDTSKHAVTWEYNINKVLPKGRQCIDEQHCLCPETPNSEQLYQMGWYFYRKDPKTIPDFTNCIQNIPPGYVFPPKVIDAETKPYPARLENLRLKSLDDLAIFNEWLKNIYHFNATRYDPEHIADIELVENVIPFHSKIRLMLDVGAGGGSIGLYLKHFYDIQSISTIFPDFPYCEYITERGGLCAVMDSKSALPFAKFSFDLIHISWVYHSDTPENTRKYMLEMNRLLRPGGYLWMSDGASNEQYGAIKSVLEFLGYKNLMEKVKHHVNSKTMFAANRLEVEYLTVWVKPIASIKKN